MKPIEWEYNLLTSRNVSDLGVGQGVYFHTFACLVPDFDGWRVRIQMDAAAAVVAVLIKCMLPDKLECRRRRLL